ncbi:PRC-barrel domain-containing protein [Candidatus Peregrinibacteria bacterium]|nr:PRC-barrel domain-containing protein [Candidatus Peregrinibacteria bacterium]
MYISSKQIFDSKVYDHDGHFVALVKHVIINPDNGHVLAFLLNSKQPNLISPQDVISWKNQYLSLGQNYELHHPQDLVRLHKLYYNRCTDLLKRSVRTENGFKIGQVIEYTINSKNFILASITVQKKVLGLFPGRTHLIHYSAIVEIKPREIIIKDSTIKLSIRQSSRDKFALRTDPTFDQALSEPEVRT